ncbi:ankyrin repeat and LEM domain-containing protein 2 [Chanos chanos]|uniref:Ankyrin repeat and LEM domain-containing protein 2 n=1 Tax=Chanos chanos TaxID=29144 RepID=A0A6J2WSW2_CHACN|nr:ankyrin repeat and LEM domain-containing protein 2-like [Chanos chanos]
MEAVLSRLQGLSADELREEFLKANLKCGPITATTRTIFERKLARAIVGEHGSNVSETSATGTDDAGTAQPKRGTSTPQETTASDEGDFGYSLGLNPPEEEDLLEKSTAACGVHAEAASTLPDGLTPTKNTQVSPTCFYGVCPPWEDVLARAERVHVYTDKKEALQAVKMMKGARFKAFANREDAEKFAKGICDYYPSPCKSAPCVSPGKPGPTFCKDNVSVLEAETINRERANSFKSPRTQDLTAKLRKSVEKGDEGVFSELIWSNPRYLIGSGDNPTVVQEGCRYNVMHVAAKENQPGVAQLLLDTLENPKFMKLMYPDDQESMLQKRIRYIVDLYLNTPDKAGFETPLHFACKFGCPEVVNILCSHPDIDKTCRNKYDQRPCDVICERMKDKSKVQEVKQKICEYLEDRCYVPLLRATDNSSQPVIGAPWSPEPVENLSPRLPRSPMDPVMAIRAFAGPLSPSKADEFRRAWKTPPRDRAEHFHHILKSDPDRGAERVGRDLARELGHPWAEYWEFLDSFVDLSSTEGLRKLEEYLSKKDFSQLSRETGENETRNWEKTRLGFRTPSPGKPKKFCNSISVGAFLDEGDDITLEEMKNRQNAALTSITSICSRDGLKGATSAVAAAGLEFHILPVSHADDLIETAAQHDLICSEKGLGLCSPAGNDGLCGQNDRSQNGHKSSPRSSTSPSCLLSPVTNLMAEFNRMSLCDNAGLSPRERRRSGGGRDRNFQDAREAENVISRMGRLRLASSEDSVLERGCSEFGDRGSWRLPDGDADGRRAEGRSSSGSDEYLSAEENLDALTQRTRVLGPERTLCSRSKSWDHGGRDLSSSGSSGSYRSLDSSKDFILKTPPRLRKGLFIQGASPTKLDREVLSALQAIDIDPLKYPSIHKWKSTVETYSASEMQSWQSPAMVKGHSRIAAYTPGSPISALTSPGGRYSPARHLSSTATQDYTSPGRYSPAHASFIQRIRHKHFNDIPHLPH